MASIINAGTTTSTALNITTDTTGAMVIQTSGANAISISSSQVVTLANALLPASGGTGITSLGTGVATFLGTPSSANLLAAVTDETGTGALVFGTAPTISSANLTGTPVAPTAAVGTNTTQVATTAFVQAFGIPGEIKMWPTASAPTGYLLCDGSSVSTTTYATLFAVVGYTFGGSGASFTLPDYRGKMPIGVSGSYALASTGGAATTTLITANLPSHTHSITDPGHDHDAITQTSGSSSSGAQYTNSFAGSVNTTSTLMIQTATTGITATNATGSGTAATTISPYLAINFIIKT
jgi:microcystin-dependent protein